MRFADRGSRLLAISALEIGVPLVRMIVLSRLLDLRELGLASALAATYAMFEQVTDIAVHRYVFSTPRERFAEALASAHALAVLRGLAVGALAVAVAPGVAAMMGVAADWRAFAVLGAFVLIRSLENLAPRVAERDYQYGAQLGVVATASGLSLLALIVSAFAGRNHVAILFSLAGQTIGTAVASQWFSDQPYRLSVRSEFFGGAFRFGYPLMINGFGLALATQGDRFVVGSLLGLRELGQYAVVVLAAILPTVMVQRFTTTIGMAALHNAPDPESSVSRLNIACRLMPALHMGYAIALLTLFNPAVALVFGRKFEISQLGLIFLSLGTYFRLARGDPFTMLLIHSGRTRRLAFGNLVSALTVPLAAWGLLVYPHIEGALLGKGLGELIAFGATVFVSRHVLGDSRRAYFEAVSLFVLLGLGACGAYGSFDLSSSLAFSVTTIAIYAAIFGAWVAFAVFGVFGLPRQRLVALARRAVDLRQTKR